MLVFTSLISFSVLPFYPSLSSALDAAPDKAVPKKVDPAPATGIDKGAAEGTAGTGVASGLNPIVVYSIFAAGAVVVGAVVFNSISSGDNTKVTTSHH